MLEQDQARRLSQAILARCGNDPAEVVIIHKDHALTRFANNTIHQNVNEVDTTVYLRLLQGQRRGLAATNRLDAAAQEELVDRATSNAAASPEDAGFPGFIETASYLPADAYDQETAHYSPHARADHVAILCRMAGEKDLNAAGAFSSGASTLCVSNSHGLFAWHAISEADFQTVVMSDDSSGRAQASSWKVVDLNPESIGREAIRKAELGRDPRQVDPGSYPVILDPYATEDLLDMLNLYGMGGQAVLDGRSWMNDRFGEQAMSPGVNIWDDGHDPSGMPMPFDMEGVPKQRVDIVTRGVVGSPVHDRTTAAKAGTHSTGHTLPPYFPSFMQAIGPVGLNLFMQPGDIGLDEIISSSKKALYVTRFWYTRLVHPRDCIVTGMTRDGVYMVEGGEIAYPVKNLRFTQSYLDALSNVEVIAKNTRLLKSEYGSHAKRVPALKLAGFNFTGVTV